jgi:hypothetical protein
LAGGGDGTNAHLLPAVLWVRAREWEQERDSVSLCLLLLLLVEVGRVEEVKCVDASTIMSELKEGKQTNKIRRCSPHTTTADL